MKKEKKHVERLQSYINYGFVSEKQAELINNLLNGNLTNCKGAFMEFIYSQEEYRKVDSAFPIGISDRIRDAGLPYEQHPKFVYSYINNNFGELINIDQLFLDKFFDHFKYVG